MPPHPSPSICSRCSHRIQWQRNFSSTPLRQALPPESPAFIHVPEPVQPPPPKRTPVKGILPVARNVFPKNKQYRATDEYISRVAVEPKDQPIPHGPDAERIAYNKQLSDVRRQTLRQGITELWTRKETTDKVLTERSAMKQAWNAKRARAPDSAAQILTQPTVHPSVAEVLRTNNQPGRQGKSSKAFQEHQKAQARRQRERIHNLYVNAQHFIVNEKQLNEELDKVFGSDDYPVRWNNGNSVWSLNEGPPTTSAILSMDRTGRGTVIDKSTRKKMEKIAEELTGGKLSAIGGPEDGKSELERAFQ